MSTIHELVARLAEQMAELWNDRHDRAKSTFTRQTFAQFAEECVAIAAEARAPEQGQVARGNDGEATEDDHMAAGSSRGAPPSPAPADDVETVRKGLDDADDYIPTRCPDICDACSHDKGHPSCQRRYREHMEARDSIADAFRALDRLAARLTGAR